MNLSYTYLLFLFLFYLCLLCMLFIVCKSIYFRKKRNRNIEEKLELKQKSKLDTSLEHNKVEVKRKIIKGVGMEIKHQTNCGESISKIRFGIVGQFQSGKSLLINCLLKRSVATVGVGMATTHTVVNYLFSMDKEYVEYIDDKGKHKLPFSEIRKLDTIPSINVVNVYINNELLKYYTLTDMPGLGFDDKDNEAAIKAINQIDFAVVVTSNYKSIGGATSSAYKDIDILMRYRVPYYMILNCIDTADNKWSPIDSYNENLANVNRSIVDFYQPLDCPFEKNGILIVNLMWYWYSIQKVKDELLQRRENLVSIATYELNSEGVTREEIEDASNFKYVEQIFSMENRQYLELKKDFRNEIKKLKDEICPIGTIQAFSFNRIPFGWMVCDGRSLSIEEYSLLYNAIGKTFGSDNDGSFRIPDLCGQFIRGWDNSGKKDNNRAFGSYQEDALQIHSHGFDEKRISIKTCGSHYHPLSCDEFDTVYDVSGLASASKAKRMCYPVREYVSSKTDLCPSAGSHSHDLHIDSSPVSEPICVGNFIIRTSNETRPQNVALLFCIKIM